MLGTREKCGESVPRAAVCPWKRAAGFLGFNFLFYFGFNLFRDVRGITSFSSVFPLVFPPPGAQIRPTRSYKLIFIIIFFLNFSSLPILF